jgi:hypothetical protein
MTTPSTHSTGATGADHPSGGWRPALTISALLLTFALGGCTTYGGSSKGDPLDEPKESPTTAPEKANDQAERGTP